MVSSSKPTLFPNFLCGRTRFERERAWVGVLQVQPELMAADSVRMEIDGGGGDDTAMPLLDNFDSLESKVLYPSLVHM